MIGQWIKWEPISGLEEKYFIKKFSDDNFYLVTKIAVIKFK